MDIYEKLQEAGLTGNETRVYLELIKKGQLSANQIAKNLGMDRTLTYTVLNHLIDKGQVGYVSKEGKKIFSCSIPDNLMSPIKAKEAIIIDLITEIKKIKKVSEDKTEINVYEGKEGVRTLMREIVEEKKFISFGGTGRAYDMLYELPAIAKKLERTKAYARIIMGKEYRGHAITRHKNLEIRYSDVKSEASTTIFGDSVSIHLIKEKPVVIIIKNKYIAETYRNQFEALWKIARD